MQMQTHLFKKALLVFRVSLLGKCSECFLGYIASYFMTDVTQIHPGYPVGSVLELTAAKCLNELSQFFPKSST